MMYGMKKTTIYLPDDLKAALERTAAAEQRPEADVIREALREAVLYRDRAPAPTVPLFKSGDPTLAERVQEALEGFGKV
jgi:plasmid stability protein